MFVNVIAKRKSNRVVFKIYDFECVTFAHTRFIKAWEFICILQVLDWLLTFINIYINIIYQIFLLPKQCLFLFVSSEFKWLWLIAGNRYRQCDCVMKVGVFDEYGGLSFGRRGWGNCIQCVKRGWNGKKGPRNKEERRSGIFGKGVDAFEWEGLRPRYQPHNQPHRIN